MCFGVFTKEKVLVLTKSSGWIWLLLTCYFYFSSFGKYIVLDIFHKIKSSCCNKCCWFSDTIYSNQTSYTKILSLSWHFGKDFNVELVTDLFRRGFVIVYFVIWKLRCRPHVYYVIWKIIPMPSIVNKISAIAMNSLKCNWYNSAIPTLLRL